MRKIAANRNYRLLKQSHPRDLWYDDRGGNDEGYHYRHCSSCGCKTEHESTPTGNVCISCDDKAREKLTRKRRDEED
jgi:hypothetical protein